MEKTMILNSIWKINDEKLLEDIISACEVQISTLKLGDIGKLGMDLFREVKQGNCLILKRYEFEGNNFKIAEINLLGKDLKNVYSNDILTNWYIKDNPKAVFLWETLQKVYDETQMEKDIMEIDIDSDVVDVYLVFDPDSGPYLEYVEG